MCSWSNDDPISELPDDELVEAVDTLASLIADLTRTVSELTAAVGTLAVELRAWQTTISSVEPPSPVTPRLF